MPGRLCNSPTDTSRRQLSFPAVSFLCFCLLSSLGQQNTTQNRLHDMKVTGPAVLALSQMAHHEACQRALGLAGGVPPLVLLCFTCQSPAVLVQVSFFVWIGAKHVIVDRVRDVSWSMGRESRLPSQHSFTIASARWNRTRPQDTLCCVEQSVRNAPAGTCALFSI